MELGFIRLIEEHREELWNSLGDYSKVFTQAGAVSRASLTHGSAGVKGPVDHLAYLKERHGEKIVAVDRSSGAVVGWVGVFPDRDTRGAFFHLAGIEVHADHRGCGIGTGLMSEVREYVLGRRASRLRFGTSPLLVPCAALYIRQFGTRYHWKEGVRLADGRPWPCVSCECDFDDPLPESKETHGRRRRSPAASSRGMEAFPSAGGISCTRAPCRSFSRPSRRRPCRRRCRPCPGFWRRSTRPSRSFSCTGTASRGSTGSPRGSGGPAVLVLHHVPLVRGVIRERPRSRGPAARSSPWRTRCPSPCSNPAP